jgi:hypothetical protein
VDLLLEGTKILGRPGVVDEDSLLIKDGPVSMLFHSHALDNLPKSVMLIANLKDFKIEVSVEFAKSNATAYAGPEDKGDDDNKDDEDGKEQTKENNFFCILFLCPCCSKKICFIVSTVERINC